MQLDMTRLPQKAGMRKFDEISNDCRPIRDWCCHGGDSGSNDRVADLSPPGHGSFVDHGLGSDLEVGQSRDHHDLHRRGPFGDHRVESHNLESRILHLGKDWNVLHLRIVHGSIVGHGDLRGSADRFCIRGWRRIGGGCGSHDRAAADAVGLSLPGRGSFGDHDFGSDPGLGQNCDHSDSHGRGPFGDNGVGSHLGSRNQQDCGVKVDCRNFVPCVDHTLVLQDHQVLATFPGSLFQLTSEGRRTWLHQQTQLIFLLLRRRRCTQAPPGT